MYTFLSVMMTLAMLFLVFTGGLLCLATAIYVFNRIRKGR